MPMPNIKAKYRSRLKLAILFVTGGILQCLIAKLEAFRSKNTKTSKKNAAIKSTSWDDALLKSGSAVRSTVKLANIKPLISAKMLVVFDKTAM
jgi:hypothetical protein